MSVCMAFMAVLEGIIGVCFSRRRLNGVRSTSILKRIGNVTSV